MSSVEDQPQQEQSTPLLSRLHRWFFAACIVLGTGATIVVLASNPGYYGSQNGELALIAALATANPLMVQAYFIAGTVVGYTLPLGLLAMAWLAMRRSPWLASIAALVVIIGVFPLVIFTGQDAVGYEIARMGSSPVLLTLAQRFIHDGVMGYYNIVFIPGTLLGPTLIGIALWRARAVPLWAAILIIVSRLLVFVYPFVPGLPGIYVQLPSSVLLFIGSIPAALAILKGRGGEAAIESSKGFSHGSI